MTTTIIIGQPKTFKKAYSVTIKERGLKSNGSISAISLNSTSFQIRDLEGNSTLKEITKKLQKALIGIISDVPKYDYDTPEEEVHYTPHRKLSRRTKKEYKNCMKQALEYTKEGQTIEEALKKALGRDTYHYDKLRFQKFAKISERRLKTNHIENTKKDWRSVRGSFLMSRMKFLMNHFNYSREKALFTAAGEWNAHRKQNKELPVNAEVVEKHIEKVIPKVLSDKDKNKLLIDMLGAVARQKSTLRRRPDGECIAITTKSEWEDLIDKIFMHIVEIANYLETPNKFKIVLYEEDKCVTYE